MKRTLFHLGALLALAGALLSASTETVGMKLRYWPGMKALHSVPLRWTKLAEGFDKADLKFVGKTQSHDNEVLILPREVDIAVFRIDQSKLNVRVVTAQGLFGVQKTRLANVHKKTGALLTVNGGFFDKEGKPDGLVISDKRVRNPFSEDGGSGALAIFGKKALIDWANKIAESNPPPDQALQNGPLLIDPGGEFGMFHTTDKYHPRTVVAIDPTGKLLIAVVRKKYEDSDSRYGINLFEMAAVLYHSLDIGGLAVKAALNLDGGTSTGMKLSLGEHKDEVKVGIELPNFICVTHPK